MNHPKFDLCLSKCPDSVCLKKCLDRDYDFTLEEKFYDVLEKVLSKGVVVRGEVMKLNRENAIEAYARIDEQTWIMRAPVPKEEGKCRKLRDITLDDIFVQSKICYENGDYWLKIKYWRISEGGRKK